MKETVVGGVSHGLWLLFAAVGCVLLIVCINLANLQLVHGILQSREIAVRAALGASRTDLLTHSLSESVILALVGGALGTVLCAAVLHLLPHFVPGSIPRSGNIALDSSVLGFSLLATTITVLLAGLLPAWRSIKIDPQSVLQGSSCSDCRRSSRGARSHHPGGRRGPLQHCLAPGCCAAGQELRSPGWCERAPRRRPRTVRELEPWRTDCGSILMERQAGSRPAGSTVIVVATKEVQH